jgi:hypothetical protein
MTAPVGIKPQDRLAWHRQLSLDRELSHAAVRVGIVISNHFNNRSGETFIGMEKLAGEVGVHRATAVKAVARLAKRGYLRVKRGGGRGLANTYAMVARESYPPAKNCRPSATVSGPKLSSSSTENCRASATPTLKVNSKKESGNAMKEGSQSAAAEDTPSTTPDFRLGANGNAVLKVYSPQWHIWLDHIEVLDPTRASLMRHVAETGRRGEWEEKTEWPPHSGASSDEPPPSRHPTKF